VGSLQYGNDGPRIEFDDRVLAHLQIVIVAKLRRNEGFQFTWHVADAGGTRRECVWMHSAIPLHFSYDDEDVPVNRAWLDVLSMTANSAGGLRVVEEPIGARSAHPPR
jgi:hypothetical protein